MCDGQLTIVNQRTDNEIFIHSSDLYIEINIIMFSSEHLLKNQFYSVSLNANNINGSAVSHVSLSEYFLHCYVQ